MKLWSFRNYALLRFLLICFGHVNVFAVIIFFFSNFLTLVAVAQTRMGYSAT